MLPSPIVRPPLLDWLMQCGGVQVGVVYGNPEITSGGNALKFYSSVRLEVRRKELGWLRRAVPARVGMQVSALHIALRADQGNRQNRAGSR